MGSYVKVKYLVKCEQFYGPYCATWHTVVRHVCRDDLKKKKKMTATPLPIYEGLRTIVG